MPQRPAVLFLLFLLVLPLRSGAQSDTSLVPPQEYEASLGNVVVKDALSFIRAAGFVLTGPLRWEGEDWVRLGGMVTSTGAAALLDDEVLDLMDRNRTSLNDRLVDAAVWYGAYRYGVLMAGGLYTTGLLVRDDWLRETGFLVGTSLILSTGVSTVVKVVSGRARPYLGRGNDKFKPFTFWDNNYRSVPSGHTIAAFAVSTVLARRIDNPWATAGLYSLATATALSRTYSRNHWLSDIVLAGFLSTFISNSIVSWYERGETTASHLGLNIVPGPREIALVLYF